MCLVLHPVRHTRPTLPTHLPVPESEDSEENKSDEDSDE